MCGRFTQQRPTSELAEIFGAEDLAGDDGGRFNVAPTDEAAIVVERGDRRAIVRYRWGLIPHWAADARIAGRTFNARAETVASTPAFRDAFRRKRCLVPVDSFYEWRREGNRRQPYRIVREDGRPLALAGLWTGWRDPASDEARRTFTIVTTTASAAIADLHDRMPVVLPPEAWSTWLNVRQTDLGELHGLLVPAEDEPLSIYPVVPLVNNVRNNGPELLERLEPAMSTLL
jgi:putative SOS response-associated peptidase YedK